MSSSRWTYVDVNCSSCNKGGRIRVDQFHRKNKTWECRSCAYTGRKNRVKKPDLKYDLKIAPRRYTYVDVNCSSCNKGGRIRVDQFHRKNKIWECRSCAFTGRKLNIKNPSPKNDLEKLGAYKSYARARSRVSQNHKGAYTNVLFLFKDFSEFWAELGPRPEGHTLDRIDVMGHYEPGNVRWATMSEQCRNKRNNIHVFYEGKKMCLHDAAKLSGMDPGALRRRIQTGCPQEFLFAKGRWQTKTQKFIPSGNS